MIEVRWRAKQKPADPRVFRHAHYVVVTVYCEVNLYRHIGKVRWLPVDVWRDSRTVKVDRVTE